MVGGVGAVPAAGTHAVASVRQVVVCAHVPGWRWVLRPRLLHVLSCLQSSLESVVIKEMLHSLYCRGTSLGRLTVTLAEPSFAPLQSPGEGPW